MASEDQVRRYLGHWFQLGRKVYIRNGDRSVLPSPVIEGNHYSQAFEQCWQTLLAPESGECYLEDTDQTITELLTPQWEIIVCCRCVMPIPMTLGSMGVSACPCINLLSWPNLDLPQPRSPIDDQAQLGLIKERLLRASKKTMENPETELLETLPKCQCPHQNQVA